MLPPAAGTDGSHTLGFGGGLLSGPKGSARHEVWRRGDHRRTADAADDLGSREQGRVTVRTPAVGETEGTG